MVHMTGHLGVHLELEELCIWASRICLDEILGIS